MTRIRKALSVAAVVLFVSGVFAAPAQAECCQGYCACTDWQTGGSFNGCQISYDGQGNIIDVTCGYIVMQCC